MTSQPSVVPARRVLVWALAGLVGYLAVTGTYLAFAYRPGPGEAFAALEPGQGVPALARWARTTHRWASNLTLLAALGLAVVAVVEAVARWQGPHRRRRGVALGPLVLVLALLAAVGGGLLAWDQVALKAVTVGSDLRGYASAFDGDARFFLVDGAEVSVAAMVNALVVHVGLGALIAGCLWALQGRRWQRSSDH